MSACAPRDDDRAPPGLVSRRAFVAGAGGAAASLAVLWPGASLLLAMGEAPAAPPAPVASTFAPGAWLEVAEDGGVTIWLGKSEMGQGVMTALPMIVAEELDADWSRVRVRQADADRRFGNQATAGSGSVSGSWTLLRTAGATARAMLVAAAARTWDVDPAECDTEPGVVRHRPTGRRLGYGALVATARTLPVPVAPALKEPGAFRLLGRAVPRVEGGDKATGAATFGLDVRVPGMLFACVRRCPVFGGRLRRVDRSGAERVPGVRHVVEIAPVRGMGADDTFGGVAVVATSTWAAMRGARALEVEWDLGPRAALTSAEIRGGFEAGAGGAGVVFRASGDAGTVLTAPDEPTVPRAAPPPALPPAPPPAPPRPAAAGVRPRVLAATYDVPYVAHVPMEPMNCVAHVRDDACEIWAPTQVPAWARGAAARLLGHPSPERVTVHTTLLGGGFGRRLNSDFVLEAVQVSRAVRAPVQLVWTREDDLQHDLFRPAVQHRLRAAVLPDGRVTAWSQRIVGPSIDVQYNGRVRDTAPGSQVPYDVPQGLETLPYAFGAVDIRWIPSDPGIRVGWWRAVGHSHNAFALEGFLDELAASAGMDPVAFRLGLLAAAPRHAAVLRLAAARAGWGRPAARGRALGVAMHDTTGTVMAQVAEVSLGRDGTPRVHRVTCAVDCGFVVNPDGLVAQVEGGVAFGLSAALHERIEVAGGRPRATNFHDYPILRHHEMPVVDVHVVPSVDPPRGIGEMAVPPVAPAVCNALYALTGTRVRTLPIGRVARPGTRPGPLTGG